MWESLVYWNIGPKPQVLGFYLTLQNTPSILAEILVSPRKKIKAIFCFQDNFFFKKKKGSLKLTIKAINELYNQPVPTRLPCFTLVFFSEEAGNTKEVLGIESGPHTICHYLLEIFMGINLEDQKLHSKKQLKKIQFVFPSVSICHTWKAYVEIG